MFINTSLNNRYENNKAKYNIRFTLSGENQRDPCKMKDRRLPPVRSMSQ